MRFAGADLILYQEVIIMNRYHYVGVFFDQKELQNHADYWAVRLHKKRLEKIIMKPHVTFEYRPEITDETLFEKEVTFRVTGYGNDGKNEGFSVQMLSDSKPLLERYNKIAVPHITLSISEDSEAVYTSRLKFEEIPPFEIKGIYAAEYMQED